MAIRMELGGRDLIGSEDDLEHFNRRVRVCCARPACSFSSYSNNEANMRNHRNAILLCVSSGGGCRGAVWWKVSES